VKYTTHLLPLTIKGLKKFVFEKEIKDYQVVEMAVTEFLEWHKDQDLVIWATLYAVKSNMNVNEVIVQALKEFREKHKEEI
jgi:fumarate hydratase class II